MRFCATEKKQILSWFEYYSQDSRHYGDGTVIFPSEAMLLKKLRSSDETEMGEYEVDLIREWMLFNVKRKFGDAGYLMGAELDLYKKIGT